jgi:hypothetical protein
MKRERIAMRTSIDDEKLIQQAVQNLAEATGKKQSVSKAIRKGLTILADTPPPSSKPELFFINRRALKDMDINIAEGLTILQSILDQLAKIGISASLEEIESWFGIGIKKIGVTNREKIKETVISKLFDNQKVKYQGLQFERANVQIPDLTELFEACNRVIFVREVEFKEVGLYWHCYELIDGKVNTIPERVEKVKNKYRSYATTPHEKQKLQKARELCEILGKLKEGEVFPAEKLNLSGVAFWDAESGRFEPHWQYIIYGLQEALFFNHQ